MDLWLSKNINQKSFLDCSELRLEDTPRLTARTQLAIMNPVGWRYARDVLGAFGSKKSLKNPTCHNGTPGCRAGRTWNPSHSYGSRRESHEGAGKQMGEWMAIRFAQEFSVWWREGKVPLAQTRMKPLEIRGSFEGVLEYLPTFFVGMVFPNTDHFKFCSIPK